MLISAASPLTLAFASAPPAGRGVADRNFEVMLFILCSVCSAARLQRAVYLRLLVRSH